MKKLLVVLLFISTVLIGLNFSGRQTIANLGATRLFTAPASGIYFINGTLSLPTIASGASANSQAVAVVSKNSATIIYQGVAGTKGFSIPSVTLVSGDDIRVSVTSNATVDQGLNVIRGDVFFGNKF